MFIQCWLWFMSPNLLAHNIYSLKKCPCPAWFVSAQQTTHLVQSIHFTQLDIRSVTCIWELRKAFRHEVPYGYEQVVGIQDNTRKWTGIQTFLLLSSTSLYGNAVVRCECTCQTFSKCVCKNITWTSISFQHFSWK